MPRRRARLRAASRDSDRRPRRPSADKSRQAPAATRPSARGRAPPPSPTHELPTTVRTCARTRSRSRSCRSKMVLLRRVTGCSESARRLRSSEHRRTKLLRVRRRNASSFRAGCNNSTHVEFIEWFLCDGHPPHAALGVYCGRIRTNAVSRSAAGAASSPQAAGGSGARQQGTSNRRPARLAGDYARDDRRSGRDCSGAHHRRAEADDARRTRSVSATMRCACASCISRTASLLWQ